MATFEATRAQFAQEHFEVLEIDLPVIEGACTIGGQLGFGTPLSCDQQTSSQQFLTSASKNFLTSDGDNFLVQQSGNTYTTRTYKFTNANAPLLPESEVYRCISSISETVTELKPSEGLSSRGSLTINFNDFVGDPNQDTAGVNDTVKNAGSFFGKLNARQVFANKEVRVKLYRVEADGSIDLINGAQTRYYSAEAFTNNGNGKWVLRCKDELSIANIDDKTWPVDRTSTLRTDITDAATLIPVFADSSYSVGDILLIGDEFMKVTIVNSSTELTVATRGTSITAPSSGDVLTRTEKDTHSAGDEIFKCRMSDDETIDSLLSDILTDSDVPIARIPTAAWATEVAEWHSTTKVNTLWYKAEEVNTVLTNILTAYLMDMWFDPEDREIKLSAISVWKESSAALTEGSEINSESIKITARDEIRSSKALAIYKKAFLSRSDDVENYAKASQFSDPTLITDVLFSKHKDKLFEPSAILDDTSAALLVQRYVSRFKFTPKVYSWVTPERKLNFNTGDVVDITTGETQGFSGEPSGSERAQILSIAPKYKMEGREYNIKAITYEPAFADNSVIVLDSPLSAVNLWVIAGAPSTPVTITFILDGTYSEGFVSIRSGSFHPDSKIIIIMINGFDAQARGGNGGDGQGIFWDAESGMLLENNPPTNGVIGGTVFSADGIDTDIYLSGATGNATYPTASGFIRAPSGGDGGFNHTGTGINAVSGNGGDGGDGRQGGSGGDAGRAIAGNTTQGSSGGMGAIDGSGSGWGNSGANNAATGGAAGKGIVKSGAVVKVFGDTPSNFINGGGDTPDV